jgi:hypothetical protein
MLKYRLYYDKDEEEDWLKEMCLKGWAFKKFFLGFYTFEKCDPGKYNYQIDILDNWKGTKGDYKTFMEDTGVKVLSQWWRWVYLQKKASDGPFEMYTDLESKITQYTRIMNFFKVFLVIEVICFFIEVIATLTSSSYVFAIFAVLIGIISLTMLKILWKCKWKIKQYKREKDM